MGKTKLAIFNVKRFFSLTFEAKVWRVWLCWLATHAGIFIPQTWFVPGLLEDVLIEKLLLVRSSMWPNIVLLLIDTK
jgi:hypothetical protein